MRYLSWNFALDRLSCSKGATRRYDWTVCPVFRFCGTLGVLTHGGRQFYHFGRKLAFLFSYSGLIFSSRWSGNNACWDTLLIRLNEIIVWIYELWSFLTTSHSDALVLKWLLIHDEDGLNLVDNLKASRRSTIFPFTDHLAVTPWNLYLELLVIGQARIWEVIFFSFARRCLAFKRIFWFSLNLNEVKTLVITLDLVLFNHVKKNFYWKIFYFVWQSNQSSLI